MRINLQLFFVCLFIIVDIIVIFLLIWLTIDDRNNTKDDDDEKGRERKTNERTLYNYTKQISNGKKNEGEMSIHLANFFAFFFSRSLFIFFQCYYCWLANSNHRMYCEHYLGFTNSFSLPVEPLSYLNLSEIWQNTHVFILHMVMMMMCVNDLFFCCSFITTIGNVQEVDVKSILCRQSRTRIHR